jgi:DNA polymerase III psi subunit
MTPSMHRAATPARRRLLDALGIVRHVRRGRYAPTQRDRPVVLVERSEDADHPLLRAILAALGIDARQVEVARTPVPAGLRVRLSFGVEPVAAEVTAPALDALRRDPAAKRALWRALRRMLRGD